MKEILINVNTTNIINNWQSLPFSKYLDVVNLEQSEDDLSNSIQLVAILTDKDVKVIETMKAKDFTILANNLEFLKDVPDTSTSTFQWKLKSIDDLTMDDFITYEALKNDENNLPALLGMMSGIPAGDINKMNTIDVLQGFFLLREMSEKYIQASARSLLWRVTKERIKNKLAFWRKK